MKNVVKYFFVILVVFFLVYLSLPSPNFPNPLNDAIRSGEPADKETPLRREYYTDFLRNEAVVHYFIEFKKDTFVSLPTYRLNYPPEEAQTKIRDQTQSNYLEEIVHPFRESIFVNGFEPKLDKDAIVIEGKNWNSKVVVRYYPSNVLTRLVVGLLTIIIVYLVFGQWKKEIMNLINFLRNKKWTFR